MFKNLHLLQAVDIFKFASFKFFYKCENRIIPDYFKNMFLTHEHSKRLQRIRLAPKHFNKMETNLPNNNNYEIKVKHTNSKYCRFYIRHEIPKLIKDNYLPGKVLEKINTHSYLGFVHYAKNYIISEYERIKPNDGHAQRKSQASLSLACGATVSRQIWRLPGAANHARCVFSITQLAKGFKQNLPN